MFQILHRARIGPRNLQWSSTNAYRTAIDAVGLRVALGDFESMLLKSMIRINRYFESMFEAPKIR